mmetsp:Transcript_39069/g.44530  ORF Transcript_39069/g.44530 Transcript_39069/m.44530 type:complete len:84 (+) Transcript_39069:107-358(+)
MNFQQNPNLLQRRDSERFWFTFMLFPLQAKNTIKKGEIGRTHPQDHNFLELRLLVNYSQEKGSNRKINRINFMRLFPSNEQEM